MHCGVYNKVKVVGGGKRKRTVEGSHATHALVHLRYAVSSQRRILSILEQPRRNGGVINNNDD